MSIKKDHAFGRQAVDVGSLTDLVPVDAQRLWRLIIGQNEKKVRSLVSGIRPLAGD